MTLSQVTMAFQRLVVIFSIGIILLIGLGTFAVTDARTDQSAIYGKQGPNDTLVYKERIDLGFWRDTLAHQFKRNITYPAPPAVEGANLTCIKVLDQLLTGANSQFWIRSGGVGQKNVTLSFLARPGDPIMYVVEIYGIP